MLKKLKLCKIYRITNGKPHRYIRMKSLVIGDLFIKEGIKKIWKVCQSPYYNENGVCVVCVIDIIL
jgi:hypothetical protein